MTLQYIGPIDDPTADALRGISDLCNTQADTIQRLENELADCYAEIRKQVFGSKVVFDRDVCERAEKAGGKE